MSTMNGQENIQWLEHLDMWPKPLDKNSENTTQDPYASNPKCHTLLNSAAELNGLPSTVGICGTGVLDRILKIMFFICGS